MSHLIDETMASTNIDKLMARKLKVAETDYRVSNAILKLFAELEPHVPKESRDLFFKACVNPQVRRKQKAASQMVFWKDKEEVELWMGLSKV